MFKKGLCIIVCIFITSAVSLRAENGSKGASLDMLIEAALENNPDLTFLRYNHRSSDYNSKATGKLPDPMLSISAVNLPRTSLSLRETPMSAISLGLTQTVPWPGKLGTKSDIAEMETEIAGLEVVSYENRIVRQVTGGFYEYAYWLQVDSLLKENTAVVSVLIEIAESRYTHGEGSAENILDAQTVLARLENRRLTIHWNKLSVLARLVDLTGIESLYNSPPDAGLSFVSVPDTAKDTLSGNFDGNPLLMSAGNKVILAKKKFSLARKNYWPDITVGFEYKIRRNMKMDPVRGEDFVTFKLGLNLPLWFAGKQKNLTHANREAVLSAKAKEKAITSKLEYELTDINLNLSRLQENIRQYDTAIVPKAEASREMVKAAYENGTIDFDDVMQSHLNAIDAYLERSGLIKEYHLILAQRDELLGSVNKR